MAITIIFFIFFLFPIFRIKSDLLNLLTDSVAYLLGYGGVNPRFHDEDVCLVDLPIIRFDDLNHRRHRSVDRMCFICSGDYDNGDVVCQLSRCGHVFHSDCVGKLLHRRQTRCPFCHSPVFSGMSEVPCKSF
ncbi:hypothetical protein L6452_04682 [Arctium lappa]|uniref:Uncharacterized protein n=1 Tax=Arctium lappa TaxID=4217 RepID=A0ACB9EDR9_ARCLA|nr:hypothetical protein L6452_04682 [Arctium lappa]